MKFKARFTATEVKDLDTDWYVNEEPVGEKTPEQCIEIEKCINRGMCISESLEETFSGNETYDFGIELAT